MCTSLQSIVNTDENRRMERDIELLFKTKSYPRFQLQEFYKHQLYERNEHFNFFLDILQQWNRKIQKQQIPSQSDTFFHKNTFIFNSLRNSIMQPVDRSQKILEHLYCWFTSSRKNVKTIEKKIKEFEQKDEAWLVRNTFKSNLPAQIGLYRRRVCCRGLQNEKIEEIKMTVGINQDNRNLKVKTQNWAYEQGRQLEKKKVAKIENEVIRFQREAQELMEVQKRWKMKKTREHQGGIKDYYRANFKTSKTFFPKKDKENVRNSEFRSVKRLHTSLGVRLRTSKQADKSLRHSQGNEIHQKNKLHSSKQLTVFDQFEEMRLSDITGIRLLNNPQQTKLKKKKRAK